MKTNNNKKENVETITGIVESLHVINRVSGFASVELEVGDGLVSAVGSLSSAAVGECLVMSGTFSEHAKYGRQFIVRAYERKAPETPEEIRKYLSSGAVKGIGPAIAAAIVDTFGAASLTVMRDEPTRLREAKGVTVERAFAIGAEYRKVCSHGELRDFLAKFGVEDGVVWAVWRQYGASAAHLIRENPYMLCDEDFGIAFETAEGIAQSQDFTESHPNRVSAAAIHILRENSDSGGHTCVPRDLLISVMRDTYDINADAADVKLDMLIDDRRLFSVTASDREWIYLPRYYAAETYIARRLVNMLAAKPPGKKGVLEADALDEAIAAIEWTRGISYAPAQKQAIKSCLMSNVFILTGGPGTGKTTTLGAIIELCQNEKFRLSLALCAPTGRAAMRISELTGQPAKTIHRLLEVDVAGDNLLTFKRGEDNPLKADVVIVDETSMVDVMLFEALLKAVKPGGRLVLIGDANQLPSVGPGNLLRDFMRTKYIPSVELTEIFRQAAESLVVTNAHAIIDGEMPELNARDRDFFFMKTPDERTAANLIVELTRTRLPAAYGYNAVNDIQILTPTKMGIAGTKELNKQLQYALNPPSLSRPELKFGFDTVFRKGDKVMQMVNDYDIEWKRAGENGRGVFNGDIGVVTDVFPQNGTCRVNFDGRAALYTPPQLKCLDLAYAVTIHKSQGSEYNAVIIAATADMSPRLLYRNLLYTGVTRAKKLLIIVGQLRVIEQMIENNRRTRRFSCVRQLIMDEVVGKNGESQ